MIAALAARHHGVISRAQLRALVHGADPITKRAGRGPQHPLHPGVYAVGHPVLGARGRWLAAVLACGREPS
jgi:hypothetical protein